MNGLKKFLFRGNLIDLAVAVVVGVAFNQLVHSLVNNLITPLIGAFGGQPNFGSLTFTVHGSHFRYGDFINSLVSFVIMAVVIYYLIVMPAARITTLGQRNKAAAERDCPECLSTIPVAARRCKFCTAPVATAARGSGEPVRLR